MFDFIIFDKRITEAKRPEKDPNSLNRNILFTVFCQAKRVRGYATCTARLEMNYSYNLLGGTTSRYFTISPGIRTLDLQLTS